MTKGRDGGSNGDQLTVLRHLDKLLDHWISDSSEAAAHLILSAWKSAQADGVLQLILQRAERWRGNYEIDLARGMRAHATGEELMWILFHRDERQATALLDRERMRKEGKLVPSVRYRTPLEPIESHEVESFMQLLDHEGLLRVFDPANQVIDGEVHTGYFVAIEGLRFSYGDLLKVYATNPVRPWDPNSREPHDAMIVDWVLVSARQQQKWTWVTCDRCFRRLPWGHPMKSVGDERPGWVWSRKMLEDMGLMRQNLRRTWRLTPHARACVDRQIIPLWRQGCAQ